MFRFLLQISPPPNLESNMVRNKNQAVHPTQDARFSISLPHSDRQGRVLTVTHERKLLLYTCTLCTVYTYFRVTVHMYSMYSVHVFQGHIVHI